GLINAMKALRGCHMSRERLAKEAIYVEQCVIREPVGSQDQVSVAFGGFNHVIFRPEGTFHVTPMVVQPDRLMALQDHLMLIFTGISRNGAEIARSTIENLEQ